MQYMGSESYITQLPQPVEWHTLAEFNTAGIGWLEEVSARNRILEAVGRIVRYMGMSAQDASQLKSALLDSILRGQNEEDRHKPLVVRLLVQQEAMWRLTTDVEELIRPGAWGMLLVERKDRASTKDDTVLAQTVEVWMYKEDAVAKNYQ